MKNRLVGIGLASILVPSFALAQAPADPPADPSAPPPPAAPAPADPNAPPPAADPVPTTEAPPPAPAEQQPVVIVNPPPPPTAVVQMEPEYETYTDTWNAPVFTSGALVFLASYGASVVVAASSEDDTVDRGNDRLYVPVVGPWLALNDRPDCPIADEDCDLETTKKVLLVADGILQAGGVITMISGLLSPTEHRVVRRPQMTSKKIHVSPSAAGGNAGLTVFGRF